MRDAGRFIVLEGGEGAGKSTQAALLSAWMTQKGIAHRVVREPGGTPVGEAIRSVVLGRTDLEMPAESELFLMLAARAAFVRDVVRPALAAGEVVLADRFALSTLAYQGVGRGLDLEAVRRAIDLATGGLEPDLYVVLDVPVGEGASRQRQGGKRPDRIEGEGEGFLRRVRDGYLDLAGSEARVRVIDGEGSPEGVHGRIRRLLESELPETFGRSGV
ncbi:MAG TPA: dTMP kinase [Longimicrobiales bacterium]|nr:dTMP kinase [Longimicrobiales bacterium]